MKTQIFRVITGLTASFLAVLGFTCFEASCLESSEYFESCGILYGVTERTDVNRFGERINCRYNSLKSSGEFVGTGSTLTTETGESLEICVFGDNDGDGMATATDALKIKGFFHGYTMEQIQFKASDTDSDGMLTTADYIRLKLHISDGLKFASVEVLSAKVTFHSNGGTYIKPIKVFKGEKVTVAMPVKAGYTFVGWYLDEVLFDFSSGVNNDMALTAVWTRNSTAFDKSNTNAPVYSYPSAALNITWKDENDNLNLRPSQVECVLHEKRNGIEKDYIIKVSKTGVIADLLPEGVICGQSNGGEWTVKLRRLHSDGEYTFKQIQPKSNYETKQSGTSVVNTVVGYIPRTDKSAFLTTRNGRIYDGAGNVVVLKGVVTVNVGTAKFESTTSTDALYQLKSIGVNCIRMTVQLSNAAYGYVFSDDKITRTPDETRLALRKALYSAVNRASNLGIYAIIDFGVLAENPNDYFTEAYELFRYSALTFKNNPYVLYEICNEPVAAWGGENGIKTYAEKIIKAIRSAGSEGVIIVAPKGSATAISVYSATSTPGDDPIDNPVRDSLARNVAYSFHAYPYNYSYNSIEKTSYGWKLQEAVSAGLTIIVTEMSPTDGALRNFDETVCCLEETAKYTNFFLGNDISLMYFRFYSPHFSNSEYTERCMFVPHIDLEKPWTETALTKCGKWFYDLVTADGYIPLADFKS